MTSEEVQKHLALLRQVDSVRTAVRQGLMIPDEEWRRMQSVALKVWTMFDNELR
jgi:hypothetical protein